MLEFWHARAQEVEHYVEEPTISVDEEVAPPQRHAKHAIPDRPRYRFCFSHFLRGLRHYSTTIVQLYFLGGLYIGQVRKLEKAVAISGISSRVLNENPGKSRKKYRENWPEPRHAINYRIPGKWKGKPAAKPCDTALKLDPIFCVGCLGRTPSTAGTFRKKFRKNSGKTPETLSERFLEFPSRVRLGCPKSYNSRHLRLPEHFQNCLPPSTAGDASFFRSGPERASQSCPWNSQQYWGHF